MFPLHDRTRRLLCRVVFVAFGVLPTTVVLAWSAVINGAGHRATVQKELTAELGFDVRLSDVSHPRPEITLLEGFELVDPETGEALLRSRLVEIREDGGVQTVVAHQPELNFAGGIHWRAIVEQRLRLSSRKKPSLRIHTAALTLHWPEGKQTLADCTAQLESLEAGNAAVATFRLADAASPKPARLHVQRSNTAGQPLTAFELQTGDAALPCSLLAAVLGQNNIFGPKSTFRGTVRASDTPVGWQGELRGAIAAVDLHALVSNRFPHQLGGTAEIEIRRARFHRGRLEEIEGTIVAGPGIISRSLLAAAMESLRMRRGNDVSATAHVIEYDELAAEFTLTDAGLVIRGKCEGAEAGTIIRSGNAALLRQAGTGSVPVVALVKTLVPDSRVQVPATRQSDWLLRVLPVPDVLPRNPQQAPQARVRTLKAL